MKQISFWQTFIMTALLMVMAATVKAQESKLTLDDLFATPKLTGTSPSRPSWAPDSKYLAFSWSEPGNAGRGLWVSTSDGKEVRLVSNMASASVRDIVWTDANTVISLRGNNLWETSLSQEEDIQLTTVMTVQVTYRFHQVAIKQLIYGMETCGLLTLYLNRIANSRRLV